MRKLIAYLAASADGYIARPNHDVGWLPSPGPGNDYGMRAFYRTIDTVVMGRKTHEIGVRLGQPSYPSKKNYVFSRTRRRSPLPQVEYVSGNVADFARRLRAARGKDVWLVGGAELFAAFLDAGQLDELVVHVVPTLIGKGIPLLPPRHRLLPLALRSCRRYPDGVVRLWYAVPRRKTRARRA